MDLPKAPNTIQQIIIDVVEEMIRKERRPIIKELVEKYRLDDIDQEKVKETIHTLKSMLDDPVKLTICMDRDHTFALFAYILHLELVQKGERWL